MSVYYRPAREHRVSLPNGVVAASEGAELLPGPLSVALTLTGVPVAELAAGTQLRVGADVVLELGEGAAAGGVRESPGDPLVAAAVLRGGWVRGGDAVRVEAVAVPLEDALDLHPFRPDEVPAVVAEYLARARAAGLAEVRLIHGRGRGVQRAAVRRLLAASPEVAAFADAPPEHGGWGATIARLVPVALA
jgi:hypothetical protein